MIAVALLLAMVNSYVPETGGHDAIGALGLTSEPHNWFCAATLVTDNVVVTAKHCTAAYGTQAAYSVRFRRNYDGSLGSIEAGPESFAHAAIQSWYLPPTGDVALGYLSHPVHHIEPTAVSLGAVALDQVTLAGWGREGPDPGVGRQRQLRLCGNEITYSDAEQVNFYSAWNQTGPLCGPNNNDSGGAVLFGSSLVAVVMDYSSASALSQYATDEAFIALVPSMRRRKQ